MNRFEKSFEAIRKVLPKDMYHEVKEMEILLGYSRKKTVSNDECPSCSEYVIPKFAFCPTCGQALEWEDE